MNPDGPPSDGIASIPSSAAQPDALSTPPAYPWATTASPAVAPYPQASPYPQWSDLPTQMPPAPMPTSQMPTPWRPTSWRPTSWRPTSWGPTPPLRRRSWWLAIGLVAFVLVAALLGFLGFAGSKLDQDGLTSDSSCSGASGHSVDFGVQVTNATTHTITLTGAAIVGLPRTLTSNDTFSWKGCDPTQTAASGQPELAPRAKQWVLVSATLNATCPGGGSPDILVTYVDGSKSTTATFSVGPLSDALPPCAAPSGFGF